MTDHAHELRRYARKIAHPAGDVPAVMRAAADEIERLQSVIAGLRADFETAHARMMTSAAAAREACAKACERLTKPSGPVPGHPIDAWLLATLDCAEVIRALGSAAAKIGEGMEAHNSGGES